MRRPALWLAIALAGGVGAAQAQEGRPPDPACPFDGQTPQLVVQLFFGGSVGRPAGPDRLISRRAWERFVADTITPALPGGFTLVSATGQWQDPATHAIGHEPTETLEVAAPDSPAFRQAVAGIAAAYRHRFEQRSVGLVSHWACAVF